MWSTPRPIFMVKEIIILPFGLVEDHRGGPGAADLRQFRKGLVDAEVGVGPVDEVPGLHHDERAVVAPAVLGLGPLPLGGAEAGTLAADVQVGHGQVETAVRPAADGRVAHAFLLGQQLAVEDAADRR